MNEAAMNVLVVDDEPKQRRGLAAMIRSLRPDYRIWEARNGREALEFCEARTFQIVFTDIQMPLLDGFRFAELVKKEGCLQPKLVFVSVFHEFGYAQQAIRLEAADYLVKPLDPTQLIQLLGKLESVIADEFSARLEKQQLTTQLAQTLPVYLERLLYLWITNRLQPADWQELQRHFALRGRATALIAEISVNASSDHTEELKYVFGRMLAKNVEHSCDPIVFTPPEEKRQLIIILKWKQDADPAEALKRIRTMLPQLQALYGETIRIGEGSACDQVEAEGSRSYEKAKSMLENRFYLHEEIWFNEELLQTKLMKAVAKNNNTSVRKEAQALAEAVMEADPLKAADALDMLLDKLSAAFPGPFHLKCVVIQRLLSCLQPAETVMEEATYRSLISRLEEGIMRAELYADVRRIAHELLNVALRGMKTDRESRKDIIMQKCKVFLEENLHEDLGLDIVAQRFFYNPSYFSFLFKHHFGMSFTDYLVKSRMQKARSLLLQSEDKINEIARKVGYKDIKYFNKVFKKSFLCAPEEFRRMFNQP
ncbi:response regulator [Paenibacillus sepulcri]